MAITFGQLDKNYVSSVDFLDQREILNQVLNITNEEKSFVDIMETRQWKTYKSLSRILKSTSWLLKY